MLTRRGTSPTNDEILAALDRVIASEALRSSPRLIAFLRFVVEETLRGERHLIKAYTIAVEALERGADFDANTDPIVRVEAGRLRRALERYYAEAGAADLVRIHIPRGSYVPEFQLSQVDASESTGSLNEFFGDWRNRLSKYFIARKQ
ncbi:MAG TPA: hypothetical protein VKK81_15360 [Candidatus Binatia bacterium]|nr:hypothetical protein [Candidatus Binatia bacterium]